MVPLDDDRPHEECGVLGIFAPGLDVARLAFFGLYALQHRGQESAGIATCDGQTAYLHKDMGLVTQVFDESCLKPLKGHACIGHNRYSTTGGSRLRNAQPYLIESLFGPLGLAHNGNLTNTVELRQILLERGVGLSSNTDSEVMVQILSAPPSVWGKRRAEERQEQEDDHWLARIKALMSIAEGAYSLTILTRESIYALRDPLGLRPLCVGQLADGGYVVASESCALTTIGARFLREIEPGEIVRLDRDGLHFFRGLPKRQPALCIFEHVYLARPDSILDGQVLHGVRQKLGHRLAQEAPADADIVIGVPDSATPAAIGYSQASGLPYTEGLTKNRYIGRTFIEPDEHLRRVGIHLKFNPLTDNLNGKRVVLVDDSIVRGNTSGALVTLLRDGGAAEVHVRVSSPPVKHPCFMGIDMATRQQLIAHQRHVADICRLIGADSLAYLSLDGLFAAVGEEGPPHTHCAACFSGTYPLKIPERLAENLPDAPVFQISRE